MLVNGIICLGKNDNDHEPLNFNDFKTENSKEV